MKRLMFFAVLVFLCGGVVAVSGVVPGSYEIDFEPGYSGEFVFDFVLDVDADLYVEGDLARYVKLDRDRVSGREEAVAILNLPPEIKSPGVNYIFIGARGEGVDVRGAIKVVVPYPEKYVELELNAPNVNAGEIVDVGLRMFNLGKQDVNVTPVVEIYSAGERVEIFEGRSGAIGVSGILDFNVPFDSSNYSAGDYVAVALVDYGDEVARVENVFRLGEFAVRILNYTDEFVEGEIGRFEIEVENLWDYGMDEVYAEVRIIGSGVGFDSSIVKLGGWEKRVLVAAFDGSSFVGGEVDAKIILHYDGEVVSEDVKLKIVDSLGVVFYVYIFGFLVLLSGLVWFVVFRRKKRRVNK
jgi:hypothetical protein